MIVGKVALRDGHHLDPWVEILVEDAEGNLQACPAIVDTGFTGWLTLTPRLIRRLGLPELESQIVTLATGSRERTQYYRSRVLWNGRMIPAAIAKTDHLPLIGMKLLEGNRLTIDAWDGGEVIIAEPPFPH